MARQSIAEELENAADRIADISRADLQIILRRAALMLRNASTPAVFIVPTTGQGTIPRQAQATFAKDLGPSGRPAS